MSNVTTLKASELVEDFDLYPRASVDSTHVNHIAEAIEAGTDLPPVIVDRPSKRIVDGFHRRRAYVRAADNDDAEVPCILKSYASDKELFLEAMRLNSQHGRNMSSYDRTYAISIAKRLHIASSSIALALNIREVRLKEIASYTATIQNTRIVQPLKLSVRHLGGTTITKEQAESIPKLGGNNQLFYVNQLILLIEQEMLDLTNSDLMTRLRTLGSLIDKLK